VYQNPQPVARTVPDAVHRWFFGKNPFTIRRVGQRPFLAYAASIVGDAAEGHALRRSRASRAPHGPVGLRGHERLHDQKRAASATSTATMGWATADGRRRRCLGRQLHVPGARHLLITLQTTTEMGTPQTQRSVNVSTCPTPSPIPTRPPSRRTPVPTPTPDPTASPTPTPSPTPTVGAVTPSRWRLHYTRPVTEVQLHRYLAVAVPCAEHPTGRGTSATEPWARPEPGTPTACQLTHSAR